MESSTFQVFSNDLITERVFSYLNKNNLKNCRQVCKLFEQKCTPILGKCSKLNLRKAFGHCCTFVDKPVRINPELTRNIYADFLCWKALPNSSGFTEMHTNDKSSHASAKYFKLFCDSYGKQIRSITYIQIYEKDTLAPLCDAITSLALPNIEKLHILVTNLENLSMSTALLEMIQYKDVIRKTLTNLREFRFRTFNSTNEKKRRMSFQPTEENKVVQQWVQAVVGSSPNLEVVELSVGNLLIDLKGCTKLKSLHYGYRIGTNQVNLNDVIQTVNGAANFLRTLKITQIYGGLCPRTISVVEQMDLPKMKNLEVLTILVGNSNTIGFMVNSTSLDTLNLPKLNKLDFTHTSLVDYTEDAWKNLAVKELVIRVNYPVNFTVMKTLGRGLPKVEKITILK